MWFINTTTLKLEQFLEPREEKYAILSHTWEDGEVSFYEFANLDEAKNKKGFAKIEMTCRMASDRGLKYAWVDTCCIDKTSSAELTEAINSMFRWYRDSQVCFAYISDLAPGRPGGRYWGWLFDKEYRWFTRGWTLQELIAPNRVEFYDKIWQYRGNKTNLYIGLSRITGIDEDILTNKADLVDVPMGRKMSWASSRRTSRVEDVAYCLLGIFDVNMPLIYGEGKKAFLRLQEEISKQTNDLSLFAWTSQEPESQRFRGIMAQSPSEFAQCGALISCNDLDWKMESIKYVY
ncbi:hypothetical protein DL769_004458 [Monosporascus sp. CRB-8-3]|nr:hypothetical protein DL769_004458 [Monosporascus sp. CRB-8-3]